MLRKKALNILARYLLLKSKQRGQMSGSMAYNPRKVGRAAELAVSMKQKERERRRERT